MANQSTILNQISSTVIKLMETEGVNWTKPWKTVTKNNGQPISIYKKEYSGLNRFHLGMVMAISGYSSPVFATLPKWNKVGAKVKKGSKSHEAIFFKTLTVKDRDSDNDTDTKSIPLMKVYKVYNADQVEGWDGDWLEKPDTDGELVQDWKDVELADLIINSSGANITHKKSDQAFYMPSTDQIVMPERKQFKDDSGYYGTMFHELVHWTGSETRLQRKFGVRFGSDGYAREELIAELGAAMLSGISRVDIEPRPDHAKYLNSWIKNLKEQPKAILSAASGAEKAAQFIIDKAKETNELVNTLIAAE